MGAHQKSGTLILMAERLRIPASSLLHPWHCKWSHQTPQPNRTIPLQLASCPTGLNIHQGWNLRVLGIRPARPIRSRHLSIQHVTAIKINPYAKTEDDNWLSVQKGRDQIGLIQSRERSTSLFHAVVHSQTQVTKFSVAIYLCHHFWPSPCVGGVVRSYIAWKILILPSDHNQ